MKNSSARREDKEMELAFSSTAMLGQVIEAPVLLPTWKEKSVEQTWPTQGVLAIGIVLALLQLADGVLTSIGVNRFGIYVEGNPVLRMLMEEFGHIPTLACLKLIAIGIVISLTLLARTRPWVRSAMGAITCIYFFGAILPWTYILFIKG